jgi:hypothetical protein
MLGQKDMKDTESDSAKELFEMYLKESLSNVIDIADIPDVLKTRSLQDVLMDSRTDVRVLKRLKSHFKKMLSTASDDCEKEIAGILYHAAISAALVFHKQRITSLSHQNIRDTYLLIKGKPYLPEIIGQLLSQANGIYSL